MRYIQLFVISCVLCSIRISSGAITDPEIEKSFEVKDRHKIERTRKSVSCLKDETSLSAVRFERLDEYILDKYTGEVSFLDFGFGRAKRIKVKQKGRSRTGIVCNDSTVNYQLQVNRKTGCYYLMNINSGDIWYIRNGLTKKACLQYLPLLNR